MPAAVNWHRPMNRPRTAREKMSEWVLHCAVNQRHIRRSQPTREAALKDACSQLQELSMSIFGTALSTRRGGSHHKERIIWDRLADYVRAMASKDDTLSSRSSAALSVKLYRIDGHVVFL